MAKAEKPKVGWDVSRAVVHIKATSSGTTVTITGPNGKALCRASSGTAGFKESRKSTPFAAQRAAETAASSATKCGVREVEVKLEGPGSGRESAVTALRTSGLSIKAIEESDQAMIEPRMRRIQQPIKLGKITRRQADEAVRTVLRRRAQGGTTPLS